MPGLNDIATAPGPNGSMPFGAPTDFRAMNRDIQSAGSSPRNLPPGVAPPPGSAPEVPQQNAPPGLPPMPQQLGGRPGGASPVQPLPNDARLDITKVFDRQPGPIDPWRQWLINFGNHPAASPALRALAGLIRNPGVATSPVQQPNDRQRQR